MKKIVVIFLGRNGAGPKFSYEMTKGLIESGADVSAIVPEAMSNLEEWKKLRLSNLLIIKTYKDNLSFVLATIRFWLIDFWRIKKEFKDINVDCCYVPFIQPWTNFVMKVFSNSLKIVTLHDPIPHEGSGKIMNYLYRKAAINADKLILLSEKFINDTCKIYGKRSEQIFCIPHGVFDYEKNSSNKNIERNAQYNFLFFGRITPYKGLELLAEAYSKLYRERKNISLYIVGSGDFSKYRELFNLDNNITVINEFIPDTEVSSYFKGNNIITVLPYTDATQSGVIPIAMREKSLLIVTNTGGLVEQTCNGKYAILSNPNSMDLYKKMKTAIDNYDNYSNMIADANQYINSLSWDKLAKKLLDLC